MYVLLFDVFKHLLLCCSQNLSEKVNLLEKKFEEMH